MADEPTAQPAPPTPEAPEAPAIPVDTVSAGPEDSPFDAPRMEAVLGSADPPRSPQRRELEE